MVVASPTFFFSLLSIEVSSSCEFSADRVKVWQPGHGGRHLASVEDFEIITSVWIGMIRRTRGFWIVIRRTRNEWLGEPQALPKLGNSRAGGRQIHDLTSISSVFPLTRQLQTSFTRSYFYHSSVLQLDRAAADLYTFFTCTSVSWLSAVDINLIMNDRIDYTTDELTHDSSHITMQSS